MYFAHRPYIVYCYLEFKLAYLKTLKLYSISVKELFEPVVLRRKQSKKQNKTKTKKISKKEYQIFTTLPQIS